MKRLVMFLLVASIVAFMPLVASAADTIEGSVQGFTCVTQGKVCPVGQEDPMAAAERVFVVLTKDNKYYFVPNVDRAVMARHLNERVKVMGKLNAKYNSIDASQIDAFRGGSWQTAWTMKSQQEIMDSLAIPN